MPLRRMDHGNIDPVEATRDRVGFIDDFQVPLNNVLLAIYMGVGEDIELPNGPKLTVTKTQSGVYMSEGTQAENKYQGVCCLVLKKGAMAFRDDERIRWDGFCPKEGDWVVIRPSDGMKIDINSDKGHCRMVKDVQVQMIVPSPDAVW